MATLTSQVGKMFQLIKQKPETWPVVGCVLYSLACGAFFTQHILRKQPELVLDHAKNPFPWQNMKENDVSKVWTSSEMYDYLNSKKE
eukprot:CAMPEP_0204596494 /NCGR_PEP_ID=MMETSP0661-20131031/53272_1 /ASSEMBLY_ACC=CAM_ASM_000606 /TAXON_ID=109239 /ORGANISM="Alexandrium margalefi, Strain AMGDE01CS-322" /LENGTH=86 /DNA_ID=CAMNT_0051607109 /DNA_START=83 /DNA_END=343 /DNA_ORIENTATION=+